MIKLESMHNIARQVKALRTMTAPVKALPVDLAAYAAKLRNANPGVCVLGTGDPSPFGIYTNDGYGRQIDRCREAAAILGLAKPGEYWSGAGQYGSVTLRGVPLSVALSEFGGRREIVLTSTNECELVIYYSSDGYQAVKRVCDYVRDHSWSRTYESWMAAIAAIEEEDSAARAAEYEEQEAIWASEALAEKRAAIAKSLADQSARDATARAADARDSEVRESILSRARR